MCFEKIVTNLNRQVTSDITYKVKQLPSKIARFSKRIIKVYLKCSLDEAILQMMKFRVRSIVIQINVKIVQSI